MPSASHVTGEGHSRGHQCLKSLAIHFSAQVAEVDYSNGRSVASFDAEPQLRLHKMEVRHFDYLKTVFIAVFQSAAYMVAAVTLVTNK